MNASSEHVAQNEQTCTATCVEIFAGVGGLALGMMSAGFRHLKLIEKDERIARTLQRNLGANAPVETADVADVDLSPLRGAVDVMCGGPPCQPFSQGGLGLGSDDTRNGWGLALRAVDVTRPKAFIFENVSSMLSSRYAKYVTTLDRRIADLGYSAGWFCVNAADFGVPQFRKRVFCVGFCGDPEALAAFSRQLAALPRCRPHKTVRDAMRELGPPDGANWHVLRGNPRPYKGHTGSVLDKPAKTIVCGTNGVPGGANAVTLDDGTYRYFTVREAAHIQTFPHSFEFSPVWSRAFVEVGNAVPPLLATKLARLLHVVLDARYR